MNITEEDHARIGQAVAAAEAQTSGEIRCVLAAETVNPPLVAMIAGAGAALVAPPIAIALGLKPDLLTGLFAGWSAAHASTAAAEVYSTLTVYILLQAAVFAAVAGLLLFRPTRRLLTRGPGVQARVRKAALEQFEALGLTHTRDKTGVLIFASLDDHRAEVLADSGIYEKTSPEDWQGVVDVLVDGLGRDKPADGFIGAVEAAAAILATHFPRKTDDANELPDTLVIRKR